ncbi:MAG: DUF4331 family protein, partial [Phycisphaerales bacterium]|nr:DUF4331 family protein [Phycisphaerales bacterium]
SCIQPRKEHQMKSLCIAAVAGLALGADHKEAPLISEDASADIADLYAYLHPDDPSRLVLAMTVNPFSAPNEATGYHFSPNVRYVFHVDTDNDGRAEQDVRVTFTKRASGGQMYRVSFPGIGGDFTGEVTMPTLEPAPNDPIVTAGPNGTMAFAGPRDDPFFFDVVGFNRFLAGTGTFSGADGFAGANVSSIVLDVPLGVVAPGASSFQVWASTERRQVTLRRASRGRLEANVGDWEQVERMGNPAVATALIPSGLKDLYNIGTPDDDASDFAADIVASLQALGTNEENIGILASVALPDTLKIDTTASMGFPNGRLPEDDVIDTLLFFIFNQTPVSDGANANDVAFAGEFPFLAPPHQAP